MPMISGISNSSLSSYSIRKGHKTMEPILDAMKSRRSIRKYKSELPDREDLNKII